MKPQHALSALLLFCFTMGCNQDEDPPVELPTQVDDAESAELFFSSVADQHFVMTRLLLADSSLVRQKCSFGEDACDSTYFADLLSAKSVCQRDDNYRFAYSFGLLTGFVSDGELPCDQQPVRDFYQAFRVSLDQTRLLGEVDFELEGNQALNQFFGFSLQSSGASSNYGMIWRFTHVSPDSINITGEFEQTPLPDVSIQFKPI